MADSGDFSVLLDEADMHRITDEQVEQYLEEADELYAILHKVQKAFEHWEARFEVAGLEYSATHLYEAKLLIWQLAAQFRYAELALKEGR